MQDDVIRQPLGSREIRTAVVGVGHLGRHHARILANLAGARLVGVVDADERRAAEQGALLGVPHYLDCRELIGKAEAVAVAVPTKCHHAVARELLDCGIHVLLEKPITVSVREADELIDLAHARGALLQVGHLERFNPSVVALSSYVDMPLFVQVERIGSFSGRGMDVDVVLDLMIHDLDIVVALVGAPCETIDAIGIPVLSQQVDIASARLHFQSGTVATLTASRVSAKRLRQMRIFQPSSYLSLDFEAQRLEVCRLSGTMDGTGGPGIAIAREAVPVTPGEPLVAELQSFLDALRTGAAPVVSGETGRAALLAAIRVRSAIAESAAAIAEKHRNWARRTGHRPATALPLIAAAAQATDRPAKPPTTVLSPPAATRDDV
ncbi:MAG: Gfo/Idh/MocA family oxidoreductase [Candidatus Schekmanbacteria bacterium]|nr:Gfo/Idh/MocA family oxidoreductase [Candidatus Schekmanbacteria bacterium]